MKNQAMKNFWSGYRAAKSDHFNCGESYVKKQIMYGLHGVSDAFYKGYKNYTSKINL